MRTSITIKHSIIIRQPREVVWDYTQNYDHRSLWDQMVIEAVVLQTQPNRIVKLKTRGNTIMTFVYKWDERPDKTTLAATEIISPLIASAGGSWTYKEESGNTVWTQTNTIIFKNNLINQILLPVYKMIFANGTKKAMRKARREIENR